jgi:hypothetical protein
VAPSLRPRPRRDGRTGGVGAAHSAAARGSSGACGRAQRGAARTCRRHAASPLGAAGVRIPCHTPRVRSSMDDHAHLPTGTDDPVATHSSAAGRAGPPRRGRTAADTTAAQPALPFDEAADHPIPFSLTARARRVVAPQALPPLTVVPSTRSRPRAAGAGARPTARRATATTTPGSGSGRTTPVRRGHGPCAAPASGRRRSPASSRSTSSSSAPGSVTPGRRPATAPESTEPATDHEETTGFALGARRRPRRRGTSSGPTRLRGGARPGRGRDRDRCARRHVRDHPRRPRGADRRVAAGSCRGRPRSSLRVVLRLGTGVAGDLARHRWAERSVSRCPGWSTPAGTARRRRTRSRRSCGSPTPRPPPPWPAGVTRCSTRTAALRRPAF